MGFAIRAEVNVITNGTLVTSSCDIVLRWLVLTQGPIAEDTIVNLVETRLVTKSIINRRESVTRVIDGSLGVTVGAEVPVRAGQALVASANDALEC